ncbi:hypothetical protein MMC07_009270 [Pseudocyphellaria aurata]|nr:hypothetical protein [Pseudocyphellaria aurata]
MASPHLLSQAVDSIVSFGNTKASSTEVTQFTRPISSPADSLAPFTYSKAKIPQMNFSRKPAQNSRIDPAICRGPIQATDSIAVPSVSVDHGSSDQGLGSAEQNETPATSRSVATSQLSVPDVNAAHSETVETCMNRAAPTTIVEASAPYSCGVARLEDNARRSIESAQESSATAVHQRPNQPQMNADKGLEKFQDLTKATAPPSLNDGELLSILLSRHKADQQNREKILASQHAKDQEISDLKGVSHTLYEQLQIVKGRERAQQRELSKFHTFKEQWEPKMQLLKECFQSLTVEHHQLGQDAKDMQEQCKILQTDKATLEGMLEDVHQTTRQDRARTKKVLAEARHEIEMLGQTVENQQRELRTNTDLLDNERDRGQRLEDVLYNITTNNEELTRMFTGHKDFVIEKLTHLLQKIETPVVVAPPPQENLKPVLDECFGILKELQKLEMVKPQDFLTLNKAVRSYANRQVALTCVTEVAERSPALRSRCITASPVLE